MNAVLQSLLGLDPFAEDLLNNRLVKSVHCESLCRYTSIQYCLWSAYRGLWGLVIVQLSCLGGRALAAHLVSWVRFPVTASFSFSLFCLKTSKFMCFQREARSLNHYQHCLKQSYPLLCIMYYVAWNVPLQYVLCNQVLLHTLSQDDVSAVEIKASKG